MGNFIFMSEDKYKEVLQAIFFNEDKDDFSESFYKLNGKINKSYGMDENYIGNLVNFIPVSESCEYLEDLNDITEHLIENKSIFNEVMEKRFFIVKEDYVILLHRECYKNLSSRFILNKLLDCNREEFNNAVLKGLKKVL